MPNEKNEPECLHIWQYDQKQGQDLWLMCPKCGAVRMMMPHERGLYENHLVARELNIRTDEKDGDV